MKLMAKQVVVLLQCVVYYSPHSEQAHIGQTSTLTGYPLRRGCQKKDKKFLHGMAHSKKVTSAYTTMDYSRIILEH